MGSLYPTKYYPVQNEGLIYFRNPSGTNLLDPVAVKPLAQPARPTRLKRTTKPCTSPLGYNAPVMTRLSTQTPPKTTDKKPTELTNMLINSQWRVLDKIGSGGFGAIFKGIDVTTKQEVAIKVVCIHLHTFAHLQEKRDGKSYLDKEVEFYKTISLGEGKRLDI